MGAQTEVMAATLVEQFDRMVKRDGGEVTLLEAGDSVVRVGYRIGKVDPTCEDGVCIMPQAELKALMGETLARRNPDVELIVEVLS